jgi:FeS assembly SUF system protein
MENEISTIEQGIIEGQAREMIRTCYDPEIPVNIFDLGLIYEVKANQLGDVHVLMTLTSPSCPAAQVLPKEVETKVKSIPGVKGVNVEVTWTPPWNPEMMSEAAKLELGF